MATDGRTLEAEELASGETIACEYTDFPNHFGFLLPLAGISTIKEIKENPIDVRATGRLNKLYVELLRENPAWAKDERRSDMNHFMARLVFCFFAEDTGIFSDTGMFTQTVDRMSDRSGSNTHEVLSEIFRAMNISRSERAAADPRLPTRAAAFPYVNGGLFSGSTEVPHFTQMARTYLLHAGALNWREINPDIFGSMIQAVPDRARFDDAAPGWRQHVDPLAFIRGDADEVFFDYWCGLVKKLGFSISHRMPLVRDEGNRPLYHLVFYNTGFQSARAAAGLGRVRVHDLRHTIGQRLREVGVMEEDRALLLGHVIAGMPQHYATATIARLCGHGQQSEGIA